MKFKNILGILIAVGLVISISGCTSQNTNSTSSQSTDPTKDIVPDNEPIAEPNGPPGEWSVGGNFHSVNNIAYSQVKILLTAYDANNKTLTQKNITVNDVQQGQSPYYSTVLKTSGKVDHVDFKVLNATTA